LPIENKGLNKVSKYEKGGVGELNLNNST